MKNPLPAKDLRIAISGHRFLPDLYHIARDVDQVLERITQVYPGRTWIVLSPLAEGADQFIVEHILLVQPAAHLQVPIPMPEADYLKTLTTPAAQRNFLRLYTLAQRTFELPAAASPQEAYLQLGRYLISHSDLLIAVWDGQPARGSGGTGDIVQMARLAKMPLAWIHAQNELSSSVTFEYFPTTTPNRDGLL